MEGMREGGKTKCFPLMAYWELETSSAGISHNAIHIHTCKGGI